MSLLSVIMILRYYPSQQMTTWNEFERDMLLRGAVERIVIVNKEVANIYIKDSFRNDSIFSNVLNTSSGKGTTRGPHYALNIGSVESFERKLDDVFGANPSLEKVRVSYEDRSTLLDLLAWIIPIALFFFVLRLLTGSRGDGGAGGSPFTFGRSTARLLENENRSTTTFSDVAGLEEAKQEVKEIVDFLKEPSRYTNLGAKIPKGVIIVGPPGTGKTLLAKAVAGEAQVPFFTISGSEFVEMFVGVGASRVRDLFKRAKEKAPCIIFIDEIDAVGRSRGKNAFYSGTNDERESTLNQLLTEMDGFGTNSGVIVLAATNRADVLDAALLRPGRFDRHIYLELPDVAERLEIFKVHLKPLRLAHDIDAGYLAAQTPGFSGADIANICNEAALIAARKKKCSIEKEDFADAIDRIIAGLVKKNNILSQEEKRTIAFHEAGHAIVSWYLEKVDPLVKVSVIPRGRSLGAAWYLPEERRIRSISYFRQRLMASLAGRAAEELSFGEVSSGAIDDLEKVTKEAYNMIAYFGFSDRIGNVSFIDSSGKSESGFLRPYSEETARMIDDEVRELVRQCYNGARSVLNEHRRELTILAELLLMQEVVTRDELESILGKRKKANAPTLQLA
jgi:AFG3 family protein